MNKTQLDIIWIIVASGLVFVMQPGFAMVESGLTRSKNSINVAIKNLTDFGISTIFFWGTGFALMFGATKTGIYGTTHFAFRSTSGWESVFFLFQTMFCSTAATIVSGAVAERMRYTSYIVSTILMAALIYPVFGHWAWGGMLEGASSGWLAKRGFVDFAGSTVVHSMGGWVSLSVLLIIGSRTGRFGPGKEVNTINGSNIPIAVLGVMLLWFGWFGFNGGSTLAVDKSIAGIIINTTLAGAAGMIGALLAGWPVLKKPDINLVLNGSLAGLVAITAPCHAVNEIQSIIIGLIGGAVMFGSTLLIERFKIDDAVGAIPVHLAAGIWGTLAVAFFGDPALLGTGLGFRQQLLVQVTGIVMCGLYGAGVSYIILYFFNIFYPLRVSLQDEYDGLNKAEHGVTTEITDFYNTLQRQSLTGEMSLRAPVEPFTEIGQIAGIYNSVMDKLESTTVARGEYVSILNNVSDGLFLIDRNFKIGPYYSVALETIFETKDLSGKKLTELFPSNITDETRDTVTEFLELYFDREKPLRTVEKLNPLVETEFIFDMKNGEFTSKYLRFIFKRIGNDSGDITQVMVLVSDITRQKELSMEVEDTRRRTNAEMELFYRILHVEPETLSQFLSGALEDIITINSLLAEGSKDNPEMLTSIFRHAHAIKGDADMLALDLITEKAQELEDCIQKTMKKPVVENSDFLPMTLILSTLKSSIENINSLLERWEIHRSSGKDHIATQDYLPESLVQLANRLAERYGKRVELSCDLDSIMSLDNTLRKRVRDIIVQFIRNSVYHGIEIPERRISSGKTGHGIISVSGKRENGKFRLVYRDDGAGLDSEKILRTAINKKIINTVQSEKMNEKEICSLIFRSDFSTADTADTTAGAGIGMNLVKQLVAQSGGSVKLRSRKDKFLEFEIQLPADKK